MTKIASALLAAAVAGIGCVAVPSDIDSADDGTLGTVSSAVFAPFSDSFDTSPATWTTFEEIVGGNPCYGSGIASVRQVGSPRRPPGKTGGSLAVTANFPGSTKSNHVIAYKSLSTDSVDTRLDYETWAMIDPNAGDGFHEGQSGPEISIQRTKLLPEGWRTMTAGIQYVANKWDRAGDWHVWTDDGNGNAKWMTVRTGTVLTPGVWYKLTLRVDYTTRTYRSFAVAGKDVSFTIDLSTRTIVKETKFSEDALVVTAESENAWSNCGAAGPFQYTVYYDDVSLTAVSTPPGQTCTGPSTQTCGNCGTQSRTCTNGKWSTWSACTGEGMCAPGATNACGCGGTTTCDATCNWSACVGSGTCGCTPTRTCASVGATCGTISDGCANVLDCGTCTAPQTCGGGGVPNVCGGGSSCTPRSTCLPGECGTVSDGCGGILDCGTSACVAPQTCGGGGVPNVCGGGSSCTPRTCVDAGATCGAISDGCGGIISTCGFCTAPQICGGGGVPNVCGGGAPSCTPKSSCAPGECGVIGDGCGGLFQCGACPFPQICGGDGVPNICGAGPTCTPRRCVDVGATCGMIADGCGGALDCGVCTGVETCGGGGVPNRCGMPTCTPITCAQQGAQCGSVGDGCGNVLQCGDCPPGTACGLGGVPNVCGF